MSKESDEEQKARLERRDLLATLCKDKEIDVIRALHNVPPLGASTPPCPWNRSDPRDAGGNRNVVIADSDGKHAAFARVETDEHWHIDLHDMVGGHKWLDEHNEWPANLRWIELPKEDEEVNDVE